MGLYLTQRTKEKRIKLRSQAKGSQGTGKGCVKPLAFKKSMVQHISTGKNGSGTGKTEVVSGKTEAY